MRYVRRLVPLCIGVLVLVSAFAAYRVMPYSADAKTDHEKVVSLEEDPNLERTTGAGEPEGASDFGDQQTPEDDPEESEKQEEPEPWEQPGFPKTLVYQNGVLLKDGKPDFSQDIKTVSQNDDTKRLVNYPSGYMLDFQKELRADFSLSAAFIRLSGANLDVKISRERSPYKDVESYLRDYPNRFLARPDFSVYRQTNSIEIFEDTLERVNDRKLRLIGIKRTPAASSVSEQNEYLLAYILTESTDFFALYFRSDSISRVRPQIDAILASFTPVPVQGSARFALDLRPVPGNWNEQTREFYARLCGEERFLWGIFYPWALTDPAQYEYIANIEDSLGYRFPLLLHYLYAGHEFPLDDMQRAYARGQTVELTMQVANFDNEATHVKNANFGLLDGLLDDQIRQFARDAARFEHPFLFRLNNEMNTDWAQYSGVRLMCDPDLYIQVWRKIYRIFEQEGVQNAIWVYNPNHRSYPPMSWNHHLSYFPGNEFVHVIGLTGYNTGDYFRQLTGESWSSFRQIYDPLVSQYRTCYSNFPWIITEFASGSAGGDKMRWIEEMFQTMPRYPEIKAALWWSYADYDYREGREDIPARRYWLDEEPEHLDAFRRGLESWGLVTP